MSQGNLKILSLGLDSSVLKPNSSLARRVVDYGDLVTSYQVIVPAKTNQQVKLSTKTCAYGVKANTKLGQLIKIYQLAKKILCRTSFDLITAQDPYYLAWLGWQLAKKFKLGLEIQVHGWEKYYGLRKLIAKYVLPRAGAVRCVSQRLKKQLINEFGVKEERITVVPIFVDTTLSLRGEERRSNLIPDKFIFFSAGRLVPVKNFQMQIEAIARLVKKYPNIELWIAGDGPEKENLKFKIRNLKLEKNIKLLGWRSDLAELYEQIDVFMLTSNAEGWPLVIVEAANQGLPIIMTDVGSAGELIINNESGLVVPINDIDALEKSMASLVNDKDLRARLGDGARRQINNQPGKKQIHELYKLSWQKALAERN